MADNRKDFEDRKAAAIEKKQEVIDLLKETAEKYNKDPALQAEYLAFASSFYRYSPRNALLIFLQNPGATFTASFSDWKKKGYSVKRNEVGLDILQPTPLTYLKDRDKWKPYSMCGKELQAQHKEGDVESKKVMAFSVAKTFDISQTTVPKEEYPEIFNMGYSSEKHKDILNALIAYGDSIGIKTNVEDLQSISLRGTYNPTNREIAISDKLEDTHALSTYIHELAHGILHNDESKNVSKSTAQIELEADAFSIMLEKQCGIELTDARTRHYVHHFEKFSAEAIEREKANVSGVYRYYSTERPVDLGTYPRDDLAVSITNYDAKTYVEEISKEAWGHIDYKEPISKIYESSYQLVTSKKNEALIATSKPKKTVFENITENVYGLYQKHFPEIASAIDRAREMGTIFENQRQGKALDLAEQKQTKKDVVQEKPMALAYR